MSPRPRYGDDPELTRATLRAAAGVALAAAITVLFVGVSVLVVGAKFGLWAAMHGGWRVVGWGFAELHWWGLLALFAAGVVIVTVSELRRVPVPTMPRDTREVPDEHPAHQSVVRLASLADMPVPALRVVVDDQPNAFVVDEPGRPVTVVVTTAALLTMTPDELEAVMAHELFHVAHGDTRITQRLERISGTAHRRAPSFVADYVQRSVRAMMRQRELSADRAAALLTGRPTSLLHAVERCTATQASPTTDLREVASVAFVARGRHDADTHPSTAERATVLARVATSLGT
jgi:heat shock protein HtpX